MSNYLKNRLRDLLGKSNAPEHKAMPDNQIVELADTIHDFLKNADPDIRKEVADLIKAMPEAYSEYEGWELQRTTFVPDYHQVKAMNTFSQGFLEHHEKGEPLLAGQCNQLVNLMDEPLSLYHEANIKKLTGDQRKNFLKEKDHLILSYVTMTEYEIASKCHNKLWSYV